ncbi:4-hydroxybenzoate polyprenyltransferase, mitochondrial [Madurella mycetomatis]|uniref:4-hydroxybenzoate polyprenyltransferase, mitochondrial n=1 Tax=Madurella mycetomatis TaxID=100816 RepID=A0A175WGJ9_9PEZI|nr:4-hydroxybenzoate polyprenyltransferase, mitochondrial [Madurella mycetomatis]
MAPKSPQASKKSKWQNEQSEQQPVYTPPTTGILSLLPVSWVPFAELIRLHQPHGLYMTYYPNILGLLYASAVSPSGPIPLSTLSQRAALLAAWTFLLRSAGCAWNDVVDQDYDRRTARCRNRPVARRAVSTTDAVLFVAVLTLLGLGCIWTINAISAAQGDDPSRGGGGGGSRLATAASAVALVVLAAAYPFGKRVTHFAQVVLGSTLAAGVPLAASAAGLPALSSHAHAAPTLCLAAAVVLLVVFYDVVYAKRDTADDLVTGVKGMAVRFRGRLEALFAVITVSIAGLLIALGAQAGMGPWYFVLSVGGLTAGLAFMIALTHWGLLPSWCGKSGWCYAFAIGMLVGGLLCEDLGRRLTMGGI